MDFLLFKHSICIRLFCFIFICSAAMTTISGQNPFDIKAPARKNTKPTVEKVQEKPVTPPSILATQEPPNAIPVIPPQTTTAPASTAPSSSGNVFDLKAGPGAKIINPKTEQNPTQSINAQGQTTQSKPDTPTAQIGSLPEAGTPTPSSTHGLQDVTNPFNIVAPKDGSSPQVATPGNEQSGENAVIPDLNEIKSDLNQIKSSTTKDQGTISKNVWFIIYIFLFLLAAVAINFNRSYPMALIKATYNQNQLRILFKDAFKGNHVLIFCILYLLFIINGGIFLYQSFRIFELAPISLLAAIGLVMIVYLLRHLVLFILGLAFPLTRETLLFSYTIGIHNLTLGLTLMFINMLLSFVDPETGKMLIFSGLSIILAMYLLRQVRGLLNNMPLIISGKFHFIIYLCTVEIAPWLLLTGILLR